MTQHRFARGASAVAAGTCVLAAAACSGSSSSPTPTPTNTVPATASLHGHSAGGPDGFITAPASDPPGAGIPGGDEVFPNIGDKLHQRLANHLLKMAGVEHVTYYPQFDQLQVFYDASASDAEREAVYRYVAANSHQPAPSPSPTARATTTPTKG